MTLVEIMEAVMKMVTTTSAVAMQVMLGQTAQKVQYKILTRRPICVRFYM